MSLFKELNPILKYLKQIRNIEGYIIFDMHFPATWKILKKFIIEDKFLNHGTVEENIIGLSFVCELNDENVQMILNNILGIITFNLEREQKDTLLQSKINELKMIFDKQSLDSLKSLKFDLPLQKEMIFKQNGTKSTNDELVGEIKEE